MVAIWVSVRRQQAMLEPTGHGRMWDQVANDWCISSITLSFHFFPVSKLAKNIDINILNNSFFYIL